MALAEEGVARPAVRALVIAHVLHDPQHRDAHQLGHVHGLLHDHAHQLLGAGDDDNAPDGQALVDGQGHVAGAGGHVDEQFIQHAPADLVPELAHHPGDDRPAPQHRSAGVLQQQIEAHDLQARLRAQGQQAVAAVHHLPALQPEDPGDGRPGDVRVQHAHAPPGPIQPGGQQRGDQALAHAALAGDHRHHIADVGVFVHGFQQALRLLPGGAAGGAAGTVMGAALGDFVACFVHVASPVNQISCCVGAQIPVLYPRRRESQPCPCVSMGRFSLTTFFTAPSGPHSAWPPAAD